MNIQKTIKDISLHLELFPIQTPVRKNTPTQNMSAQIPFQGITNTLGVRAVGNASQETIEVQYVEKILEFCTDDSIDEMMTEYGEESVIGQLIRRKRAEKYRRKLMNDIDSVQDQIEKSVLKSSGMVNPFYDMVCHYIDDHGYKSDSAFYNAIGMPRQLFARMRDPEASLSKKTVLWIVIGLKLDYLAASRLLSLAGFSFKKNSKKDVILSYIIRNTDYDIFSVNEILEHFGEDPFC